MTNKRIPIFILIILPGILILSISEKVINYAPILTQRGIEKKNQGEYIKAIKYFNKALYHNSNYAEANYQLSTLEPDDSKRKSLIHKLLFSNSNEKYAYPLFSQGMRFYQNKEYEAAQMYFIRAIHNNSALGPPIYYSSICAYKLGNKKTIFKNLLLLRTLKKHELIRKIENETKVYLNKPDTWL